mgnify:CR=1 FL=1
MSIQHKSYSELYEISLSAKETALQLNNKKFETQQGLKLNEYEIFKNIYDVKNKNYSVNLLTDNKKINSFLTPFNKETQRYAINSRIAFFGGSQSLSASQVLEYIPNSKVEVSPIGLTNLSFINNNFTINFIDDEVCTVKANMDSRDKFLVINASSDPHNELDLRGLNNEIITLSSHHFNYSIDDNGFFQLGKKLTDDLLILGSSVGTISAFSTHSSSYASDAARINVSNSAIIKLIDYKKDDKVKYNNLNNFIFYDIDNRKNTLTSSITGDINNYISYYLPENFELEDNIYKNELRFFNTQNQISNNYNINNLLPFKNSTQQRKYTNILNLQTKEKEQDNLKLGYTFYTKEFEFTPDKYTKFTLHDNLYPYTRINVNDSSLSDNGALAGSSPYFSDKIFKLLADSDINIKNTNNITKLVKEENDFNIILEQGGDLLFNFTEDKFENDGTILCSWLSGNDYEKGMWYDRYYNPQKTNYTKALTGNTIQTFEHKSLAEQFFNDQTIDDIYYDVKSNLTFEPKKTYYYQRIGNNYISSIIDASKSKLLKSSFNLTFTGTKIDTDIFNLKSYAYDKFNLFNTEKSFSIGFDVTQDALSSLDTYNLLGNYYKDGISLLNNFYFTPFVIIPQGNELFFFDGDFNLLKKNSYPDLTVDANGVGIKDVLFLEQNNSIVIVGNNKVISTNFIGVQTNQASNVAGGLKFIPDLGEYRNRIVADYGKAYILKNRSSSTLFTNGVIELNLNNLSFSGHDDSALQSGNSLVTTASGLKPLQGYKGKKINDDVGASINLNKNEIIFQNIGDGSSFSNSITANNSTIYDINTFEDNLYVQAFDDTTKKGKILRYTSDRQLLSTYTLNTSAVSGFSLEFFNDNREIKLLSFAKRSDQFLTVDKFTLNEPISSTFNLNLSSVILSGGDEQGATTNNVNLVSFNNLYNKYKDKQGKFHLKTSLDTFTQLKLQKDLWNVSSLVQNNSAWNVPTSDPSVMNWNTHFITASGEEKIADETFTNIDIGDKIKFNIILNFNLDNGVIEVYIDGKKLNEINFSPNIEVINKLLYPDFYFNIPLIDETPISNIIDTNSFYSEGASINNLKIYSDFLSNDFIKFINLENKSIDKLVFDIPCGMRNNMEEFNNLYNYNVPGFKNNTLKVYIRNAEINENSKEKLIDFLTNKLSNSLPTNIDKIIYDLDINYNK